MITVLKPGLLTTVQDAGRAGYRAFGMPLAGALDADAYAAANLLAGNTAGAAAIELTLLGGSFRFETDARCAITGADLQAKLDDRPIPPWSSITVRGGATLSFSHARAGVRGYLAVRGGVDVPAVLGSRSTYTRARVGGFQGRALAKGDVLPVGAASHPGAPDAARWTPSLHGGPADAPVHTLPAALVPVYGREIRLRAILGPQEDRFLPEALAALVGDGFTVNNRNDRMGYLLDGPALAHAHGPDIVSDGIVPGSVQVPGSGIPIVMMADCATVGGYTKIATVISADLPRIAQARTGDRIRFERCTYHDAVAALRERAGWLEAVARWLEGTGTPAGGGQR